MVNTSPQFTAYDVLGYLVPGLAFYALVDCSFAFHHQKMEPSYTALTARYMNVSWQAAVPLALVSYFIGHLISFVSAMTLERYARWRYGHPMKFLLDDSAKFPPFLKGGEKGLGFCRTLLRLGTALALAPIVAFEAVLLLSGILPNYIRSMGKDLALVVKKALEWLRAKAGMERDPSDEYPAEFESLAINYTLESAPSHIFTLRNYIVLYGFLRSMTLVMVLMTWTVSLHVTTLVGMKENCIGTALLCLLVCLLVGGFFCTICYGAYLKFWTRYNKEALMGLAAVYLKEQTCETASLPSRRKKFKFNQRDSRSKSPVPASIKSQSI